MTVDVDSLLPVGCSFAKVNGARVALVGWFGVFPLLDRGDTCSELVKTVDAICADGTYTRTRVTEVFSTPSDMMAATVQRARELRRHKVVALSLLIAEGAVRHGVNWADLGIEVARG